MIPGMIEGFSISLSMTKKIGVKGITCTLLATFLLLSVGPSFLVANEVGPYTNELFPFTNKTGKISFFKSNDTCSGSSVCCHKAGNAACCAVSDIVFAPGKYGFSASVEPPSDLNASSTTFLGPRCSRQHQHVYRTLCSKGERERKFGSGIWLYVPRYIPGNTNEAELGSEKSCKETVSPDTFQYKFITEDRRWASWVLPMASLAEADSDGPLLDLPAEEQVIWFKSRGATLEVEDHQITPDSDYMPVPDNNTRSGSIGNPRP